MPWERVSLRSYLGSPATAAQPREAAMLLFAKLALAYVSIALAVYLAAEHAFSAESRAQRKAQHQARTYYRGET